MVERWRGELRVSEDFVDALDRSTIEFAGYVKNFRLEDLRQLTQDGHRAELEISGGAWAARVIGEPGDRFLVANVDGPADEAFPDQRALEEARAAWEEGRATDLLALTSELDCRARITLENALQQAGFRWIRTMEALETSLRDQGWVATASVLWAPGSPRRLVIHDAASARLATSGFVVHGPDIFPEESQLEAAPAWSHYSNAWLDDVRSDLPLPVAFMPVTVDDLEKIAELFRRVAHGLSWLWLASSVEVTDVVARLRFEGAPDLDFDLSELPGSAQAAAAVRLWEWAVASTDPARREATQQAVSLVVREPAMLLRWPERVLRTAKFLLRLAQQGAVAEALAIRRSARQAAIEVGRAAAEGSRAASRSVVDRVLTQLIGGFGVLLANRAALIDVTVAGWLLLGLLGLTVATAIVAFLVEFPAVSTALNAFTQDLDEYSDMLVEDDIKRVKAMESLRAAGEHLRTARFVSGGLLLLAALALVVIRLGV